VPEDPDSPPRVALKAVCATVATNGGYETVLAGPVLAQRLSEAYEQRAPVWLELTLESEDRLTSGLFDGSFDVWELEEEPGVDWEPVTRELAALRLKPPRSRPAATAAEEDRVLYLLPLLHAEDLSRVRKRWFPAGSPERKVQFLPIAGFAEPNAELDHVWCVRANAAVLDDARVVITIRLPDLLCTAQPTEVTEYRPPDDRLYVSRKFVVAPSPDAADMAEAVALYQAATVRSVSDRVRTRLAQVDSTVAAAVHADDAPVSAHEADLGLQKAREDIKLLTEIAYQLDHQVSGLLRRFGACGAAGDDGDLVTPEVRRAYQYALDEVRQLGADCRLEADKIEASSTSREQNRRDRFQTFTALLGAAIIGPTLVAAIYGANVDFPARDSWQAFVALLLLIFGLSTVGILATKPLQNVIHRTVDFLRTAPPGPGDHGPRRLRYGAAAAATAAICAAVVLMKVGDDSSRPSEAATVVFTVPPLVEPGLLQRQPQPGGGRAP
jgi:hypothetical protein